MPTKQPDCARRDKEQTGTFGSVLSISTSISNSHSQTVGWAVLSFLWNWELLSSRCRPNQSPTSPHHVATCMWPQNISRTRKPGDKLNLTHVMETAQWSSVQALSIWVSAGPTLRIRAPGNQWKLRRASSRDKKTTAGRKKSPRS